MGKGHYHGGGTLIGFGSVAKTKGRSGGVGSSRAALREQRQLAERKKRQETAAKIKANVRLARKLGKQWNEARARARYEELVLEYRAKASPLTAALRAATRGDDGLK